MRLKLLFVTLFLLALPCYGTVGAEVVDPTSDTWSHPVRVTPIEGLDEHTVDSDFLHYNDEWYIALSSEESTLLTTIDESGYMDNEYAYLENEIAPRLLNYNDMVYISTIHPTEYGYDLILRSTFDGQNWVTDTVIHTDTGVLPLDYDITISSEGVVNAVWSETNGNERSLVHMVYESAYESTIEPLGVASHGAFTTHHSPTVEWRDGCLNVAWISNQFKPPAHHISLEHEEVVFASKCNGVFSYPSAINPTFTSDSYPHFLSNSDEPMVVFSSLRTFNKEFDSEVAPYSNIWVSNINDGSITHQLPPWNTDEFNPSGAYADDRIGVIWHDHSGIFLAFSGLEFDNSEEFDIPTSISMMPSEIDVTIESAGFIDDVVIQNTGQIEVFGQVTASENLVIQTVDFRIQPGESVSFWVQFNSEANGKYFEEISITSNAGDFKLPVTVRFEGDSQPEDPEIPDSAPPLDTSTDESNVDFTLLGIFGILFSIILMFIFANKHLPRKTSFGLAIMVIVMFVTPLSDSMLAKADLYYGENKFVNGDDYEIIDYELPNEAYIHYFNNDSQVMNSDGSNILTYPGSQTALEYLASVKTLNDVETYFTNDYPSLLPYLQSCDGTVQNSVQALDVNRDQLIEEKEMMYQKFECLDEGSLPSSNLSTIYVKQSLGLCFAGEETTMLSGFDSNSNGTLDAEEVTLIETNCPHPQYSEYLIDPVKFEVSVPYPVTSLEFANIDHRGNKDVWMQITDKNTNNAKIHQITFDGVEDRTFLETRVSEKPVNVNTTDTMLNTRYGGEFEIMLFSTLTEGSSYIYGDQLLIKSQPAADRIEVTAVTATSETSDFTSDSNPTCAKEFSYDVSNENNSFMGIFSCSIGDFPKLEENGSEYQFGQSDNFKLVLETMDSAQRSYSIDYKTNNQFPALQSLDPKRSFDIYFINDGQGGHSIDYRERNGESITEEYVQWKNAVTDESARNNIELTLGIHPPIITTLLVNNTDRFFKFEDPVPIYMSLANPYPYALNGEVKLTAVDLTTSTLHSAVHCFDVSIAARSDATYNFDVNPSKEIPDCRNGLTGNSTLYPDHTYFLIADFIPDSGMEAPDRLGVSGKSVSRHGANATHIMSEEISPSMFTITYGDVISDVRIIHEDYRIEGHYSDKLYIIHVKDAASTLQMDTETLLEELYYHYNNTYDIEIIDSTQAFQEMVQRAEYGATVINLMGNSLPIPRNYLTIPYDDDQFLGNWNIEGFSNNPTSVSDKSRYNNEALLFGNPEYTSRHHYGVSSILFDGEGDYFSVEDSEATVIHDSTTGLYYLKLGGMNFSKQNARHFNTESEALEHAPSGLYALKDEMQFHISFMVNEFNQTGSNLIASYGHQSLVNSGWKMYVNEDGKLNFAYNVEGRSSPYVVSTLQDTIKKDEWYSIYVNLKNDELSLIVNDKYVELEGNKQNPYQLSPNTKLKYVVSDEVNQGLLVAGWDQSADQDSMNEFRFSNILVDKLTISDKIVEVNSAREPSEADYERAEYWINIFGSYISESNINFVNIGHKPFEYVSNDASDWDRKRLRLGKSGFDSMLNNYSLPASHVDCTPGPISWSTDLNWDDDRLAHVIALEETSFARKSLVSESLLANGDTDQGCSVVERYPIGDGAVTQVNLDFSNPIYIDQSVGSIVDVIDATIQWNPEVIYVFNVRQKTSCEVVSSHSSTDHKEFKLNADCVERSGIFSGSATSTSALVDIHPSNGAIIQGVAMTFEKLSNGQIQGTFSDSNTPYKVYAGDRLIFDSSGVSTEASGMVSLLSILNQDSNPGGEAQNILMTSYEDTVVFTDQTLSNDEGVGDGALTADITVGKSGASIKQLSETPTSWLTAPPADAHFESGTYLLTQDTGNHQCRVTIVASAIEVGHVAKITMVNAGSLYETQTNVPTSGGDGSGLTVDIVAKPIKEKSVLGYTSLTSGSGYTSATGVQINGYGGSGLVIDVHASTSNQVATISIIDGGTGYTDGEIITIPGAPASGTDATFTASVGDTGGEITSIDINNQGVDYSESSIVDIAAGNGNGNGGTFQIDNVTNSGGEVSSMVLDNPTDCENDYSYSSDQSLYLGDYESSPALPPNVADYRVGVSWEIGHVIQEIEVKNKGDGYEKGQLLTWTPPGSATTGSPSFTFRVDSISNQDNANLIGMTQEYNKLGQFRFVEINDIEDYEQVIMSNIENSIFVNYNSQGILPMPDRYITGAQPQLLSSALFNFELIKIGYLEVTPNLANYPEEYPVEIVVSYDSGVAERFEMITEPREFATEETSTYTWMPDKNNLQMTTAILASQINNRSSHLTAVAANNIISLELRPDVVHNPSNIDIVSTNDRAIVYTPYDLLEPVDTSTHREKGTISGDKFYWHEGIFDNTGLGLKTGSKFSTSFEASKHISVDFWMTIYNANSLDNTDIENVAKLMCMNSESEEIGSISLQETHFAGFGVGKSSPVSLSLSDFDWTDSSGTVSVDYYINRVKVPSSHAAFSHAPSDGVCSSYAFEITPTGKIRDIVIDHVHVIQDPNIGVLNEIDIDIDSYMADFGDFFAHNKNTLALDYRQPFTHISLSMESPLSEIYTDIMIQKPLASVLCVLGENSIYVTEEKCAEGARAIQTIPEDHPGAVPVCINDLNSRNTYYAGYDNCYGNTLDAQSKKYTTIEQKMVIYALDSGVPKSNAEYCTTLDSESAAEGSFRCLEHIFETSSGDSSLIIHNELYSSLNHLVLPSDTIYLSGLNRLYPNEMPPIYDVHDDSPRKAATYDFDLRSDLFEFIYANGYYLPETMPEVKRHPITYGLFSPTDLDWMYSVYKTEEIRGTYVGPGMFDIGSGTVVLADTSFTDYDFSMEMLAQILWATQQHHRLLHVIPDVTGDVSIDSEELESIVERYRELGYIQITDRSFSPGLETNTLRLYDALDGIYMHGGDDKILILSDPTSVMMPKHWYSGAKISNTIRLSANMDLVDNIDRLHAPRVSIPFSEGFYSTDTSVHERSGTSDYTFVLKSNSIQDLFVELDAVKGIGNPDFQEAYFWNGLDKNTPGILDGENPEFQVGLVWSPTTSSSSCSATSSYAPLTDIVTLTVQDVKDDCNGIWSLEFKLEDDMRISYTRALLSADLLSVDRSHNSGSNEDVTSTFQQNSQSQRYLDGELVEDDSVGFESSSIKVMFADEGFDASELGLMFNHWIARNGHCLVLAANQQNSDFLFSEIGFMHSDAHATAHVDNLNHVYDDGSVYNRGFASFTSENTGGLSLGVYQATSESQFVKKHGMFFNDPITASIDSSIPPRVDQTYSYVRTTSSKHLHGFVEIRTDQPINNQPNDVAIRAFVPIQRGGIVFAGDGDLSSIMPFALQYSTQEKAVQQRLGLFTKGDTITVDVTVDLTPYPLNQHFESTYLLSGKKDSRSPISQEVLDSTGASLKTGRNHTIRLSWTIPSSMSIGYVSLRVDAIDTVLDRMTSTWGDKSGESLGLRINSHMYIIDVETPLMVGAFDDADINVIVYNEMRVENLIDVSIYLTHGDSAQPVFFETQEPVSCRAKSRCKVRLRWDATSNYAGQTREIGTYQGKAYIDDHVTRYQVVNRNGGQAVMKPAIIDSQQFDIEIQAQLEIVLPGESSKWKLKFGDGPWEVYNGGEIIRKFGVGSEFHIQPIGIPDENKPNEIECYTNADPSIQDSLTIRFLAKTDSPSYLLYHLRTDDQYRDEPGCGANENRKTVVEKFKMDGTTYSIPMDGLEQNAMVTVSTELLYDMGSITISEGAVQSMGNFDRWTSTDYLNDMIKIQDTTAGKSYYGYYTTVDIFEGADGWYSYSWATSVENLFAAVINISDFTPGFGRSGGNPFVYSFNKDTSQQVMPYHGAVVEDTFANFFIPAGKFVVFIGSSEWGAVTDISIQNIQFGKGHAITMDPKASCPYANYNEDEYNKAVAAAAANQVTCPPYSDSSSSSSGSQGRSSTSSISSVGGRSTSYGDGAACGANDRYRPSAPTSTMGIGGLSFTGVPGMLMGKMMDCSHHSSGGFQVAAGKESKGPVEPTGLNLDTLKIGWEGEAFISNLRLYVKIPFVGSLWDGEIMINAIIEVEIFLSSRFFERWCTDPSNFLYCVADVIIRGDGDEMLESIGEYIGFWSTFTLTFSFDISRYIPPFLAFHQEVYSNGYSCIAEECYLPGAAEEKEGELVFEKAIHFYIFFGVQIGIINNVAACSQINVQTEMGHIRDSQGNLVLDSEGKPIEVPENSKREGETWERIGLRDVKDIRGYTVLTETGERFGAIMSRAQASYGICPETDDPKTTHQLLKEPDGTWKGSPGDLNFEISLSIGFEIVLDYKVKAETSLSKMIQNKWSNEMAEHNAKAEELSDKAAESNIKAWAIKDSYTSYCKAKQDAGKGTFGQCVKAWKATNEEKVTEMNLHRENAQRAEVQAAAHKKHAESNEGSKKKFRDTYGSPFTIEFSVTVKFGVFFGIEIDCLSGDLGPDEPPCTVILDLELVVAIEVTFKVELFKICFFGACWTPSLDVEFKAILDKIIYINMIGFNPDYDENGQAKFCNRDSSFNTYNEYSGAVGSAVNRFSFGGSTSDKFNVNSMKEGKLPSSTTSTYGGDNANIESAGADDFGSKAAPPPAATYPNSKVSLKILFFEIKVNIPNGEGC